MIRNRVNRFIFTLSNIIGQCNVAYNEKSTLTSQYSEVEQECVLKAINNLRESSPNFKMSKSQHKVLHLHLKEKKEFRSLGEILELNGIGPRLLQRICREVLNGNECIESSKNNQSSSSTKTKSSFVTPGLTDTQKQSINSFTGIEIGNFYISWTKLDFQTKTVTDWNLIDFSDIGELKNLINLYEFVIDLCKRIPASDVYVFEGKNWSVLSSQTSLVHHIRAVQITSMLLPLLNNESVNGESMTLNIKVYFLKSHLPTRYFRTLIGKERVSPQKMVEDMFEGNFPEHCSHVGVKDSCEAVYFSNDKTSREALCQSFLLTVSFMDIVLNNKVERLKTRV